MADTKISALPNASALTGPEQIPGVQSAGNVNITPAQLKTFVNDNPTVTGAQTVTGGTVTASAPLGSLTQTWNNAGVAFTGWLLNITSTASAALSRLLALQVGGVDQFVVLKDGSISFSTGTKSFTGQTLLFSDAGFLIGGSAASPRINLSTTVGVVNRTDFGYGWSSSNNALTGDTAIYRDAAGIVAQRTGASAQSFRIYNTYTDASNYERGMISWQTSSNRLTIGAQAAGTGTLRPVDAVGVWNFGSPPVTPSFTVATLPAAPGTGARAMATDASLGLTAGVGTVVSGGGANVVPVHYDGTNWRIG